MSKSAAGYVVFASLAAALCGGGLAQAQSGPGTVMSVDWRERHAPNGELQAHDSTLLGDAIDLGSGRLTFEHIDVSLPGNSALPVEIRRRLNPSQMQSLEFADWHLAIPTISTKIFADEWYANNRWKKTRCSGSLASAIPNASWPTRYQGGSSIPAYQYSDGVILDVPGRTQSQLLDKTVSAGWPASATKVTADGWYLQCMTNIDGAGTEGFLAVAPNGDRYKFNAIVDTNLPRTRFDIWQIFPEYPSPTPAIVWREMAVFYDTLGVTEITDVDGNWVRFAYDSNRRLQSITSNDGRRIDIGRSGRLITSVTANPGTVDQRQWSYVYANRFVTSYSPPSTVNGAPGTRNEVWGSLNSVTLPNGRQWLFDLANLQVRSVPGINYGSWLCKQHNKTVSLTHPDGVTGTFTLEEVSLRLGAGATGSQGPYCPNTNQGPAPSSQVTDVIAVTNKTLSSPSMVSAAWQYSYVDTGNETITSVIQPDNSKRVYYHPTPYSFATARAHARLTKEEVFATASASVPLEVTTYTYLQEPSLGSNFLLNPVLDTYRPVRVNETTLTRGSDWYRTRASYNTDRASSAYSHGFPTRVEQWSSLGGGTRQTDTVYAHNISQWILGLPSTVTKNGKLFDSVQYDALGRVIQHDRFGSLWRTYGYHTGVAELGAPRWSRDALNRMTYFRSWKRGVPREVERADAHKLFRTVDDNGWVKSITDWRGYTTNYSHDAAGRLTGIDLPSPWNDTTISYSYSGGYLVRTKTHGTQRTTTTYDAMLRPRQVRKESLNGYGGNIYVENSYDAKGRAVFTSLPSASPNSTIGVQTSYDALDRMTQVAETASGGGTTGYEYLAGNKTRITDPVGNQTTNTASGWGSPADGQIIRTERPEGITVDSSFDIYGNLTSIAQLRNDGTQHVSSFEYDSKLRLCRRKIPETGDTLYGYDNANQMTSYAEGMSSSSGCVTPPSGSAVNLGYDLAGRLLTTDYPSPTLDISRSYDANGNLLTINRGGANWTYTYNSIDLLETESLTIDSRTYLIDPTYDPSGTLVSKRFPSGRTYDFVNDGHGRPKDLYYGSTAYLSSVGYHPNGAVSSLSRGSGGTYSQQLNARQLVSHIGGNWGTSLNYVHDLAGRITQIDSPNNSYDRTFTYDGAGRLKTAFGPWGSGSYQYDRLGNITQRMEGSRVVDIAYNAALNRVSSVRDTAVSSSWRSYTHDSRGNVTGDGIHTFTYDFANQPVSIAGADAGTFVYDGNLKRVKQVIDGGIIYSIYDRSGALLTRDNVTAGQMVDHLSLLGQTFVRVTNGTPSYPLNDHLGTAFMVASSTGSISASDTFNFRPFGEGIGNDPGTNNRQGFTGHIEDETGLTYMQARYYDPVIGRFLSPDPIGYGDGLNIYAYVGNDPTNRFDPFGSQEEVPRPPPPPPPSPPEPTGPYAEDGVTLLPVEDGPYVDGEQKILKDTTGAGEKVQEVVDAIIDNKINNDIATDAKARGDKDAQEYAEQRAAKEKARYEELIGQPNRPPLVIHPDGSHGGPPQEGDYKVPQ